MRHKALISQISYLICWLTLVIMKFYNLRNIVALKGLMFYSQTQLHYRPTRHSCLYFHSLFILNTSVKKRLKKKNKIKPTTRKKS